MEVLHVLRTLWRRRIVVVPGVLAAAAVLIAGGRGASSSSGVAYTRVALDTPRSQLIHAAPLGADSLGWRASLLAHLVATDATKRAIARLADLPAGRVAVVDPTLAVPAVPAALPKAVADATAAVRVPYVLSVFESDGSLPILAIQTAAPDRAAASRLAGAAATVLESESSPAGTPGVQPFTVQRVAPIHARTVVTGGGLLRSLAMAVFVLGAWCACVALAPRLPVRARRRRRPPGPPDAEGGRPGGRFIQRVPEPPHNEPGREPLTTEPAAIAADVRRGLLWSTLNSLALRLGSLAVGMVLARLLAPEDFGVYAIALTVQSVLATFVDLGLSADLVRSEDPARRAPTVATLSLCNGVALAVVMTVAAGPVAGLMGAPQAATVVAVLSWTLVLNGAGVVPYALLQRSFQQRRLFGSSVADFTVGTTVTIALILLGMGPMALAIGRLAAQAAATTAQFLLAGVRPRFGFDRSIARSALGLGVPLAGANVLSWALLNIDNVVIAHVAGTTALGLYVLAFNVSSWPMSAIGQAVRSVSLAGFSRTAHDATDRDFTLAMSLTWAAALLAGTMLAALAHPLVLLLYGARWSASATVLAALGLFGALRVALDLIATYLIARGAARPVLYVQVLWSAALIPAVVVATRAQGIAGAAWAHVAVSALLVLPAYALALTRVGLPGRALVRSMWLPTVAAVPAWYAAHAIATAVQAPLPALVLGGLGGSATYLAICGRRLRRLLPGPVRPRRRRAARLVEQPATGEVAT